MMFCLIGLPRCRTAWFSNLLSCDGIVCDHDIPSGGDGYSGTILLEEAGSIPTVVIHRPVSEVVSSLKARFKFPAWTDFNDLEEKLESQAERMLGIEGIHINYSDLDAFRIGDIWRHLRGTAPDMDRINRLLKLNVQVNYTNIMDSLEA